MPLYDFQTITHLTSDQKQAIADGVTTIHSTKFGTPRLFVNVIFQDHSSIDTFVAGKPRNYNKCLATVRAGPSRTSEHWDAVCSEICALWGKVVGTKGDEELRAIFVLGSMIGGSEAGFPIPRAGEDAQWMKKYAPEFKKLADAGDKDMQEMLEEVKGRPEFSGMVNGA